MKPEDFLYGGHFLQAIMDNMIDGLIVIDATGNIQSFNQAAQALFGYEGGEAIGQNISALILGADGAKHDDYISGYIQTGMSSILGKGPREVTGRHKDGHPIALELNIGRIDSEEELLFVGSLRDITERKRAGEAIRQSQEVAAKAQRQLVDAIESIPEGFALYDKDRRMILHNETLREMYHTTIEQFEQGATFDEILQHATENGAIAEAVGREDEWIAERLGTFGKGDDSFEQQLDGGRWVLVSDRMTRDGGIVSVRTDITELKQREEELRQAQKMEALGQLTGGIAHDFNNLLAIMMGNIGLLEEELGPGNKFAELTQPTLRAIDQAAKLTNRMLSFARQQPMRLQPINMNELLVDMQPLLRQALVAEINIAFTATVGLWDCTADHSQLEQTILNLALNARDGIVAKSTKIAKTAKNGETQNVGTVSGRLHIETANVTLPYKNSKDDLDLPPGEYVSIAVIDNGCGIAAENLEKIFDPFFTTKGVGEGSGLGLSMVHGFIKQSNGEIIVKSEVDYGTTIRIYLPRTADANAKASSKVGPKVKLQRTAPENSVPSDRSGRNETVLVIEDEEDVRTIVAKSLERLGCRVIAADTGTAGLEVLGEYGEDVDLLLTDVLLPEGMNGQEVADLAREKYPKLKVLFMSGYARDAIIDQGRLRPDVQLLGKPFTSMELQERIVDMLDKD